MQVKSDATEGAYHPEHIKIRGGCLSFQMKLKRYVSIIQKKKTPFFFSLKVRSAEFRKVTDGSISST